jgi:heptosyltransferase-2
VRRAARIIVIRVDNIGDVVLSSSFLRSLRAQAPGAHISLVVKPDVFNLAETCPYIDEVLIYDWPKDTCFGAIRQVIYPWRFAAKRLQDRFDIVFVPRRGEDIRGGHLLAYLSRAPVRIGSSERGNRAAALLTHGVGTSRPVHEVEYNMSLLPATDQPESGPRLEVWVTDEDRAWAEQALGKGPADRNPRWIAVAPGAASAHKQWPAEAFALLSKRLIVEQDSSVVILGASADRTAGKVIGMVGGDRVLDLTGRTTLRQAAAILGRCDLLVSNDSAPVHMAAACGTPVVVLSCQKDGADPAGTDSSARFRPWNVKHLVLHPTNMLPPCLVTCNARESHCIRTISVEKVLEAAAVLYDRGHMAPHREAGA